MYGTQPAEQAKTVVQTNDPQPDHYCPHRKDGHKAQFPGSAWVLVVNHGGMEGWMEGTGNERWLWKRRMGRGELSGVDSLSIINPEGKIMCGPVPPAKASQSCGCSSLLPLSHPSAWWLHCRLRLRFRKVFSNWFISHRRAPSILIWN